MCKYQREITWKTVSGMTTFASGFHETWEGASKFAYLYAFRMGMPFPSIRRHWWQIWRKKYSADEIEVIDRAWKEVSDEDRPCHSQSVESDRQTNLNDMGEQQ